MKNNLKFKTNSFDEFKFNKYMAMYPFNNKNAFQQWLKTNNLKYEDFLLWFNKENPYKKESSDSLWIKYLENSYESPKNITEKYKNKFGVFVDFIVERSSIELDQKLKEKEPKHRNINPQLFKKIFIKEISEKLISMAMPTLTLELNVARVSNKLHGKSSEDRFLSYIKLLSEKKYIKEIFKEYPVLLNRLIKKAKNAINEILEIYSRIVSDYDELIQNFGQLGDFIGFTSEQGDDHNGGRSVRIFKFTHVNIVYKPRSLKADIAFQELLKHLNTLSCTHFKTYYLLDKKTYGWSDYIKYKPCKNLQEYKEYYINVGHYLALLYLLNSSDFHFENIISDGVNPMLIDLESIFHVNTNLDNTEKFNTANHTVLNSMILPQKQVFNEQEYGIDISSLGYKENQQVTNLMGGVNLENRDDMKFGSTILKTSSSERSHSSSGKAKLTNKKIGKLLCEGFEVLYKEFLLNPKLLSENEPFKLLSTCQFRCILRPTDVYCNLINYTLHPDYLRNFYDFELYVQQKLWLITETKPQFKNIIKTEISNIISNNVPIFHFNPSHNSLILNNEIFLKNVMFNTPIENIRLTQEKLSTTDLKLQLWLIKASIYTKEIPLDSKSFKLNHFKNSDNKHFIHNITKNLIDISLNNKNTLSWKNFTYLNNSQWALFDIKSFELFEGSLGTILYLLNYTKTTQNPKLNTIANQTLLLLLQKLNYKNCNEIGGFEGLGGIVYGLSKIYEITNNKKILPILDSLTKDINKKIIHDKHFDVIYGSAGAILALLTAFKIYNNKEFITTCHLCAKHLIKNSISSSTGICWLGKSGNGAKLGGFSHGVSGIGYALALLGKQTNTLEYLEFANSAIDYEDSLYDLHTSNFIDLRNKDACHGNHSDTVAWCNGILGIYMSRLDLLINNVLPKRNKQFQSEIDNSITKILQQGLGHNHSLCHGDAGTLEYFFQISTNFPKLLDRKKFLKLLNTTISNIHTLGYKNGAPFELFSPGLMIGSLGLAYQCMRFNNPNTIGNILLLK